MRRVLTLAFLCVSMAWHATAQTMQVVSFELLENDLTANTHGTERMDQNGERAALIKIQTPERGFTFDGGSLGIVATEEHAGEIWLYVPRRAQKLIVAHSDYGVLRDYYYPIPIEGGRTYEMFIDIGIGRYVSITSERAKSTIYIDGEPVGESPVSHRYLPYGRHVVRAVKDRYEGEQTVVITTGDEEGQRLINIAQRDMSDHYGDVTVTVAGMADIYFEDRVVGNGTWQTQLREGNYTVETRKADCDPAATTFTVVAQQQNDIQVNAPTPHTGWLSIYTDPGDAKTIYNGSRFIDLSETVSVPIGTYNIEFSRRGYQTRNVEYQVRHNETTSDTVRLAPINYIKPKGFYFGLGFTGSTLAGVSVLAGAIYQNHDLQLGYTFGIQESGVTHWKDRNGYMQGSNTHRLNEFSVKYGYQIRLLNKLSLTPQLGYALRTLSSTAVNKNTLFADGAMADLLTVGAKVVYVPMHHLCLFAAPELGFALQKDDAYYSAAQKAGFSEAGFAVHVGVMMNFNF